MSDALSLKPGWRPDKILYPPPFFYKISGICEKIQNIPSLGKSSIESASTGTVALSQDKLVKAASKGITVNKRTAAAVLVYLFPVACSSAAKLSHVSDVKRCRLERKNLKMLLRRLFHHTSLVSLHTSEVVKSSPSLLSTLRKKTGYAIANCKKALELNDNDIGKVRILK